MPKYRIIVDLSDRQLYLLDNDVVVRSFPVGIGRVSIHSELLTTIEFHRSIACMAITDNLRCFLGNDTVALGHITKQSNQIGYSAWKLNNFLTPLVTSIKGRILL